MACGCQSACGCNIVGDGTTAEVAHQGDTFTVSAILPIRSVADTDCVALDIAPETLELTASPILSTAPRAVELECTPGGLAGILRIDPDSTAIVTQSVDGLRVDMAASPAGSDGIPAGAYLDYAGVINPPNYIDADGTSAERTAYPNLFDALTLFATTATRVSGSAVVTGIASTRFIVAGMVAEIEGFGNPLTVVSVDDANTITVSGVAADSDSGATEVRVFVYGDGDGDGNTFSLPLANGATKVALDNQGGADAGRLSVANILGLVFGGETVDLVAANMPLHGHTATGTAGASSAISGVGTINSENENAHTHAPGSSDRSFVTVDTSSLVQVSVDGGSAGTDYSMVVGDAVGVNPLGQLNNANTGPGTAHHHAIDMAEIGAALAVSTDVTITDIDISDSGFADPVGVSRVQPSILVRTLVHI